MRFAIDAHALGRHLTGNEVYIRGLLHAYADLDRQSEFLAYVSSDEAALAVPERFGVRRISPNPFIRLGLGMSHRLRQDRPDLVHVQYSAPLLCPTPVVATVHDVSYLDHPEFFTRARRQQLRMTVAQTVKRAARVLTVSEFSRQRILSAYQLPEERVVVVPNASDPLFRPMRRELAQKYVRERFGLNFPFILTVGDLQPRKNHIGLIRAFAELVRTSPNLKHHLVLAGKQTWFAHKVRAAVKASGVADRIVFTDFVSDHELRHLYNACDMFVFPSFYEGFGIPILEAMACGRAVACSDTSAMPEVADGAGIFFDPHDIGSMTRAMGDVLRDADLRARMERLGTQRAAHFSWRKSANLALDVYYEVAGASRPVPMETGISVPSSMSTGMRP